MSVKRSDGLRNTLPTSVGEMFVKEYLPELNTSKQHFIDTVNEVRGELGNGLVFDELQFEVFVAGLIMDHSIAATLSKITGTTEQRWWNLYNNYIDHVASVRKMIEDQSNQSTLTK